MANPLKLNINNVTQYELDKLVQIFHAANALCLVGIQHDGSTPAKLMLVPRFGYDMLQTFTFEFSEHIGDGKRATT
jgi:hypothetical protein